MEKNLENAIQLLRAARKYLYPSQGVNAVYAVYVSPAQQMRNSADELDYREKICHEIDEFLATNSKD